jgi:hypothetical protein
MGGVLGGEDRMFSLNECMGIVSSSSSEGAAKFGDVRTSVMVRDPRKKETSGPVDVVKCGCLLGLMGDDWASW